MTQRLGPAVLAVSLLSALAPARADGPATTQPAGGRGAVEAPVVLVTATRGPADPFETPYSVDSANFYDLVQRKLSRTVPEAFEEMPGVMVQKTSHGQGSPYIRGFTGYQTLMLIDGIRLNNATFRSGPNQYWNTVDPYSLDRLELVRGGGSVLYGSDAIGGVANAITRAAPKWAEGGWSENFYGRLFYRLSTAERSHVGRLEVGGALDRHASFVAGGDFKHFGDIQAGGSMGRLPKTGYEEWDGDFKFTYRFNQHTELVLYHSQVHQNNAWRTHKTIYAQPFHGTTVGSELKRILDQDRSLTYAQLHATDLGGAIDALHVSLSWQEQNEVQHRLRTRGRYDDQGVDVGTLGASVQLESPTPVGRLTYGVEHYHDNVNSYRKDWSLTSGSRAIQGPVADEATYDLFGAFVQDQISLCDRAELVLGGRYTHAGLVANKVEHPVTGQRIRMADDWEAWTGSARLLYRLTDHVHAYGGVSQGFRAPNLSDLTRLDTARTGEIETPVPDGLDPERFVLYEGGLKVRCPNFSAQAAYYFTDIRDMIIRSPTGRVIDGDNEVTKTNAGDGFVQGVELAASWRFRPQWTLFGNVTWTDGEVDAYPTSAPVLDSEPLSRLMPPSGSVGLRWNHPRKDHWVELVADMAADADDLSTADTEDTQRVPPGGTPGYVVLNLRSGWQVTEDLALTVSLENLTNASYRVHGSGQNEPGIGLVVGANWKF